MIRCDNCGTNNIDGSEYCDECGMRLDLAPPPRVRRSEPRIYQPPSAVESEPVQPTTLDGALPSPPSFTTSTSVPRAAKPARSQRRNDSSGANAISQAGNSKRRSETMERGAPSFDSEGKIAEAVRSGARSPQTFALSSPARREALDADRSAPPLAGDSRLKARLVVERGGRVGREFAITGIETNIGRWDADSGIFPDVDLDEDDPEAKISRRHARIVNHDSQYFIEDLGSTNGTFVNRGRRLLPGKRQMLQNGDEIIVGKTFLKFQVLR
ncbi:MAG: FHA domain-containing protein [Acidobacteriota bacterium]